MRKTKEMMRLEKEIKDCLKSLKEEKQHLHDAYDRANFSRGYLDKFPAIVELLEAIAERED